MRRIFSFFFTFLKIAILAAAALWVYLHPGTVNIEWQGTTITTSFGFTVLVGAVILFAFGGIYHGWRVLLAWPRLWRKQRQVKSLELGYKALNKGLLAVAGNDSTTANKQAKKALNLLPDAALSHLLAAQAAQLSGDDMKADTHLAALAQHPDGQLFGLRGQLTRALARSDNTEGLRLARVAYQQQPTQPWIIDTVVQMEARQRNWLNIEKILRDAISRDSEDKTRWKNDLGAALLALCDNSLAKNDLEAALECAREALKRNPGWTPAALRVADIWRRKAYRRRAQKVLINAWELNPHPELVDAWLGVSTTTERNSDAASTVEKLISLNPDHPESALAMARAYYQAGLWGIARQQALRATDRRAYRLLADIEQADNRDTNKVRSWLEKAADAPAEPHWVCKLTHDIYDTWHPLNRQQNFNTIEWTTSVAPTQIALPDFAQHELITV